MKIWKDLRIVPGLLPGNLPFAVLCISFMLQLSQVAVMGSDSLKYILVYIYIV